MSKEVEEELSSPSSEVHFPAHRSIIGVRSQDVDCDSEYDCKILWPVIFAGPCVIFAEDDVERPMQLIFDAPVRAGDLQHAHRRQTFGHDHVMHRLGELAITHLTLGYDAAAASEAGKVRRLGRPLDDAGAAPLAAVMSELAFFMEGEFALLIIICSRKCGLHA